MAADVIRALTTAGAALGIVLGAAACTATSPPKAPTYSQGWSYGASYMAAPSGGNLIVPVSVLPKVCVGIARGNPYGIRGALGANPGAAWMHGCEAGIGASPHFDPPAAQPQPSPPSPQPSPPAPQATTYRAGYRYGSTQATSDESCADNDPAPGPFTDSFYPVIQGTPWFRGCMAAHEGD